MARHAVEHKPYPPVDEFILLNPHPDMSSPPFVKLFDVEALEYVNAVPSVDQRLMVKTISAWAPDIIDRYNMVQCTWCNTPGTRSKAANTASRLHQASSQTRSRYRTRC